MVPFLGYPVEIGRKNLVFFRFLQKKTKNLNCPDSSFRKTVKIQILDSQSQQKIVAFQSN